MNLDENPKQYLVNQINHYKRLWKLVNSLYIKDIDKGYILDLIDTKLKELKFLLDREDNRNE